MEKCRYIALTDISASPFPWAEKDDIQSLIRLLLYSNEIDLEGIILCSSCFLKKGGGPRAAALVNRILDVYESVRPNLDCHAAGYPEADRLRKIVCMGIPAFGNAPGDGFAEGRYGDVAGVRRIIDAVDAPDPRPVWVGLWGGANTLAQAVWQVGQNRSEADLNHFLQKLRIHSISDQDNGGKWLRHVYGDRLFYIVTPSQGTMSGAKDYYRAVWPGISADQNRHGSEDGVQNGGFSGASSELVGKQWLQKHIRSISPLGRQYPETVYIMEGDTPSFLGLIPNGLNVPERTDFGGWAGRYAPAVSPEGTPIWTGAADRVMGNDEKIHCSPQASLWRWRPDFQYDFAARMGWTVAASFQRGSHPPVVRVGAPSRQCVRPGQTITLDASASESPDGAPLSFHWFWYAEAGNDPAAAVLSGEMAPVASVTVYEPGIFHLILKVTGARDFPLCRYWRTVLECENSEETDGL